MHRFQFVHLHLQRLFSGDALVHDVDGDGFGIIAVFKSETVDGDVLHRVDAAFELRVDRDIELVECCGIVFYNDPHIIDRHIRPALVLQFCSCVHLRRQPSCRDQMATLGIQMEDAVVEDDIMRGIRIIRGLIQHRREVIEGTTVKPYCPEGGRELIIKVHEHHVLERDIPPIAMNLKPVDLAVLNQCRVNIVFSNTPQLPTAFNLFALKFQILFIEMPYPE